MSPSAPASRRTRASRGPTRALAAIVAATLVVGSAPTLSAAQDDLPPPAPVIGSVFDLPDTPSDAFPLEAGDALEGALALIPESIRAVPVVGSTVERTEAELAALEATILENRARRDRAFADIARLTDERQTNRTRYASLRERRRSASLEAEELRAELARLAVAAYVGAGNPGPVLELDASSATEAGRQQAMVDAVDATLRDRMLAAEARATAAGVDADRVRDDLARIAGLLDDAVSRRDDALAQLAMAEPDLPRVQERYRDQFMLAQVEGADFTVVALHAYRTAADRVAEEQPSCRLPWSVLAGIGRVESRHGTYGGATLRVDGTTSRRILGVALDGGPGIMLIPDTDGGALDGDAVYDRAVGPMQFIPSTWRMVRRDANGNGRMDPHNIYDAALAAAVYLCRGGVRLDQAAALNRAILTYNRSQPYVNTVLGHHREYQRLRLP